MNELILQLFLKIVMALKAKFPLCARFEFEFVLLGITDRENHNQNQNDEWRRPLQSQVHEMSFHDFFNSSIRNNFKIRMTKCSKPYSHLRRIDPKMFISSVASLSKSFLSFSKSALESVSTNFNQYRLSFASLRQILILITKSFFPKDSFLSM